MGLQRIVDQVWPFHISSGVKTLDTRQLLSLSHSFIGKSNIVLLLINREVFLFDELSRNTIGFLLASHV